MVSEDSPKINELEYLPIHRLHNNTSDLIRVSIGGGSPILEVALAFLCTLSGNSDRGTTVGNSPSELLDARSLVFASHTQLVAFTVDLNVLDVSLLEFLHSFFNMLHSTLLSHLSRLLFVSLGTRDWRLEVFTETLV